MADANGHVDQVVIIRMWQEDTDGDGTAAWRGRIEHLNSGSQTHFVGLDTLLETVRAIARSAATPAEP